MCRFLKKSAEVLVFATITDNPWIEGSLRPLFYVSFCRLPKTSRKGLNRKPGDDFESLCQEGAENETICPLSKILAEFRRTLESRSLILGVLGSQSERCDRKVPDP
jgi:hypothetical protein